MKLYSFPIVAMLCLCFFWQGCDDNTVEPGPFAYPIELQASGGTSNVRLIWTEAKVSSFEEYIIIRSTDEIPDTPEPEVVLNQVIIERIDEVDKIEYTDFTTPLEETIYYKVYADIGDRFLMSPTIKIEQDLQLIDYRVDIVEPDPESDAIIGFDRSFDILFVYDYNDKEIKANRNWSLNFPILRSGTFSGTDEVYVIDQNQSTLNIFRRSDLVLLKQYATSTSVTDYFYANGLFFIAYSNGEIEVRNRSTFFEVASLFGSGGTRILHKTNEAVDQVAFIEVATTSVRKFLWNGSTLQQIDGRFDISSGSQPLTAFHPDNSEFIINNTGRVMAADLSDLGSLGTTLQFHNAMTYSDNGEMVATVGFTGNSNMLHFYSVEEGHPKIRSNELSFTPVKMWSDKGKIYTCTVVFTNGGVRSVINTYDLP